MTTDIRSYALTIARKALREACAGSTKAWQGLEADIRLLIASVGQTGPRPAVRPV